MATNLTKTDLKITEIDHKFPSNFGNSSLTQLSADVNIDSNILSLYKSRLKEYGSEEFSNWTSSNFTTYANPLSQLFLDKLNQQIDVNSDIGIENDLLKYRSVILNEKWTKIINIQSIIISFNTDLVQCECLIDKDEKLFETRSFPSIVFDNIPNLAKEKPVLISIKSKPGSIKIDVIDGKNFVDKSLFETNKTWEQLENKFKKASIKVFKPKNA